MGCGGVSCLREFDVTQPMLDLVWTKGDSWKSTEVEISSITKGSIASQLKIVVGMAVHGEVSSLLHYTEICR